MLRADAQAVINAGYNLKVALAGPEVGVEVLEAEMQGKAWGGAGIGFGVRSAQDPDMTLLFIDTIDAMRKLPVEGPIVFNYNAKTFLWALQQRIPLAENCTTPGTDYVGFPFFEDFSLLVIIFSICLFLALVGFSLSSPSVLLLFFFPLSRSCLCGVYLAVLNRTDSSPIGIQSLL